MDMPRLHAVSTFGVIAADYMSYEITVSPTPNAEVTASFPQNSLSVSLACESLLSVFTRTQVVRTRATRRKQHTE